MSLCYPGPFLLGCLNFVTSLNDSALERRAPRGSDRAWASGLLPILVTAGEKRAWSSGQPASWLGQEALG
uniref:Uncharacterized protein n=1 Tax=Prolemur simus TaxID=1328070 RepID=A0A8C9DJZ1_PROSS